MTWREIRFKLYVATPFVVLPIIIGLVLYNHFRKLPDAKIQISVKAVDFKEPMNEAMDIWNRAAGCIIFVPGDDVWWGSTDGEPCGKTFHSGIEDGHSAGTYECKKPDELRPWRWEIHVEKPGHVRTQACIALHELGHVLGLKDTGDPSKLMYTSWCPPDGKILWPSDSESKEVERLYCE
jgi:hypothetical protein